ncbi:unnamed protein product [Amoebophrya sp. A25]|nr:unnamed protein product [Amoebophrya sp. A25]|eukprot:GSA25T00019612001.1
MLECGDLNLFVSRKELPDALRFFGENALEPEEHVMPAVLRQLVPFPRISFFHFVDSDLLQHMAGLADYALLGASVTISPDGTGSGRPATKWNAARNKWGTLCLSDESFRPVCGRLIVGKRGCKRMTIVNNAKCLQALLGPLVENEKFEAGFTSWEQVQLGYDGDGHTMRYMSEAVPVDNLKDVLLDYEVYAQINDTRDKWKEL